MIRGCESAVRPSHFPACVFEALESLLVSVLASWGGGEVTDQYRRGDLVDEMPVWEDVRYSC